SVVAARMSFLSVAGAPASDETIGRLLADPPKAVLINATFGGRAPHAQQSIARLASTGVPVVMHYGDSGFEMADRVGSDHEGGAYQVARWLAGQGRQRILRLWIGDGSGWWLQAHDRGYERAMAECGLP